MDTTSILTALFLLVQAADIITTMALLSRPSFREVGPLMRYLVGHPVAFIGSKVAFALVVLLIGEYYLTLGATLVPGVVVLNNARLMWRS